MQCMSERERIRKLSSYPAINLIIFLLVYLLCLSFFPPMGILLTWPSGFLSAWLYVFWLVWVSCCLALLVWLCLSGSACLALLVCLWLSLCLYVVCPSACFLSVYLSIFLSYCISDWLSVCLSVRANAWIASFETLYGGQFMLLSQLIIPNYLVLLFHWCNTTVSCN